MTDAMRSGSGQQNTFARATWSCLPAQHWWRRVGGDAYVHTRVQTWVRTQTEKQTLESMHTKQNLNHKYLKRILFLISQLL